MKIVNPAIFIARFATKGSAGSARLRYS